MYFNLVPNGIGNTSTERYSGENDLNKAKYLSKYLFETFPNNSIFHRYYAQILYRSSNFYMCEKESQQIINNYITIKNEKKNSQKRLNSSSKV